MQNLIGIIILLAIGIWVVKMIYDKKQTEIKEWPDLPEDCREVHLEGMEQPMVFPQYGYYRYRTFYYKIVQVPCIFTNAEPVEDQIAYAYYSILDGKPGYAPAHVCTFLGQEKPNKIIKF